MFETTISFWKRLVGRGGGATCEVDERRLWVRCPTNVVLVVQPAGNRDAAGPVRVSARMRDISLGGTSLLVDMPFEVGQLISLELPGQDGDDVQSVLACVVRVNAEGAGQWGLGCIFSRELANEDLEGLGARRIRPQPDDKRQWVRFPTSVEANFQKVGDLRNEAYSARVINVSASGVGLWVTQRVAAGELLSVDFRSQDGAERTILACVVHVSPREDGEWALGCNFIRELSEEDLRTLI